MNKRKVSTGSDHTNAALATLGITLMWVFFVIWLIYGIAPVLVLAVLVNHGISRLAEWQNTQQG